ncbi:MAG: sulfatase-like hydrolase/transferase [Candidatus Lokiarchaeota archaeon]|nr:sulfatase-like hydrolase/transferase [Candidatus Lokiarchaeota archaeon]
MGKKHPPDIVYILEDHQSFYAHGEQIGSIPIHKPNFQQVASEGIEFTRAYTCIPLCGPARRTMLTGLYPHNHKEIKNETHHSYDKETYFERLTAQGYDLYYFGKWHTGPGTAHQFGCEGFSYPRFGNPYITDEYKEYLKENNLPPIEVEVFYSFHPDHLNEQYGIHIGEKYNPIFPVNHENICGLMTTPKESHEVYFFAYMVIKNLRKIAQERKKGNYKPFHLRLDFYSPHQPYYVTKEFLDLYPSRKILMSPSFSENLDTKPDSYKVELNPPMGDNWQLTIPNRVSWRTFQEVLAFHYAQQTMADEAAGMVIDAIRELGLEDNMLLMWMSDHGDGLGCHGGHFDKEAYMPEELLRTPLAIKFPGVIKPGQKSTRLVSNIDYGPTILDAAGTKFTEIVDGISLFPLFKNPNAKWRDELMSQTYGNFKPHFGRALITDSGFKYIYNENDMDELYDLNDDPYELKNLIYNEDYNDILKDLKIQLEKLRKKTGDIYSLAWVRGRHLREPKQKKKKKEKSKVL